MGTRHVTQKLESDMLLAWIGGTILYWLLAYLFSRWLGHVHLAFAGWILSGMLAVCICFNLFVAIGGGIVGVNRIVFIAGCSANGVAGLVSGLMGVVRSFDGARRWRELYWQGTIRERGLTIWRRAFTGLWATPIVLAVMIVGIFVFDITSAASLVPRNNEQTFAEFAARRDEPLRLVIVRRDDGEYLVWIGRTPNTIVPHSGPPCYVFDSSGKLIDYSTDTGDDHHLAEYVDPVWDKPSITLLQARQFLEKPK